MDTSSTALSSKKATMASSLLGGIFRRTIEEKISCEFPRREASLFGGMFKGTTEVKNSCEFPRRDSKDSGFSSFLNINFFKRDRCRFLNKITHDVSRKYLLPHEVTSLENDIGSKKSHGNSEEEFGSQCFEINDDILFISETAASEDSDSFRVSMDSAESSYCEDHTSSYFTLSDFSSSKVKFEIEEDVKLVMVSCEKGVQEEVCPAYTLPFEPQSPAKHKIFIEVKCGTSSNSNGSSNSTSLPNSPDRYKANQEVCSKSFGELNAQPKLRKSCSLENKVNTYVDKNDDKEEEEESDNTLCKKKILMGRRCRPLRP